MWAEQIAAVREERRRAWRISRGVEEAAGQVVVWDGSPQNGGRVVREITWEERVREVREQRALQWQHRQIMLGGSEDEESSDTAPSLPPPPVSVVAADAEEEMEEFPDSDVEVVWARGNAEDSSESSDEDNRPIAQRLPVRQSGRAAAPRGAARGRRGRPTRDPGGVRARRRRDGRWEFVECQAHFAS